MNFNLAQELEGHNIDGWNVIKKYCSSGSSGGHFSVGYLVKDNTGREGFLKALDYSSALLSDDVADALNRLTKAYLFERELLEKCNGKNTRYVVRIITAGQFRPDPNDKTTYPVSYIILEKADRSIREIIDLSKCFDNAWALRSLHNIAVGTDELHRLLIAHQDIKPSNVLFFDSDDVSKLGDVGRASSLEIPAEHDTFCVAGDHKYAPFEQLYGVELDDWKKRRFSCDMFMFGNLIMCYFNNISIVPAVYNRLDRFQWPDQWGDSYSSVLPFIETAFAECMYDFNSNIDENLRQDLITMVTELCNPDFTKRGDVKSAHLGAQQYSLQKYITRLDLLSRRCENKLVRVIQ